MSIHLYLAPAAAGKTAYDIYVRWKPLHQQPSAGTLTSTTACG